MHEVGAHRIDLADGGALQQGERLQKHRALAPGAGLGHGPLVIVVGQRRFRRRAPIGEVVGGQHAFVARAAGVHRLGLFDEGGDLLGDEAAIEAIARGLDLRLAAAPRLRFPQQPFPGVGKGRIAEQLIRCGRLAARAPGGVGCRPFLFEEVRKAGDGRRDARQHRMTIAGVVDRRFQDVAQRQLAVVAQHQHPAVERAGNDGRQHPIAGDQRQALAAVVLDGRAGRSRSLAADHLHLAAGGIVQDHGQVAARAVQVRLDHLQHEAGGGRRVECVAALFQNAHADGRGDPVGRGDDAERAPDFRSGGEGGHPISLGGFPCCCRAEARVSSRAGRARRATRRRAG